MQKLISRIKQEGVLKPGGRYLIALSGGCDSVALLFLLYSLQKEWKLSLYAAHVNHGLRESAGEDEDFCRKLCRRLEIPLKVFHENIALTALKEGMGQEEAGRQVRYRLLSEEAVRCGCEALVTAHQREDQAETLLLHLLRGSGLPGLGGMKASRPLTETLMLLRPLLSTSRQELEAYLRELGEGWREDESNRDTALRRNYLRHEIMPRLEEAFPGASGKMARSACYLQQAEAYMNAEAERFLNHQTEPDSLSLAELKQVPEPLLFYIFRRFLDRKGHLTDLSEIHFEAMRELLSKRSGARLSLPRGARLLREQKAIRLLEEGREEIAPEFALTRFPFSKEMTIPENRYTKWMDCDIINGDLCLRHRQQGDYITLPEGRRKSIHRFMIDEKIPLSRRDALWLLADGSHILWVVGSRLSYKARISETTKTVLQVSINIKE